MEKVELRVDGMTCDGCVKSVQKALNNQDGVQSASADLDSGIVSIDFDPSRVKRAVLEKAIVDAGFEIGASA